MHSASYVHHTPDGEDLIVRMARVSNPSNQDNTKTGSKLIKYLIDHQHWSPFEMASMCLEINTTRSIAAQILRHRSFSFQEFSQRYSDPKDLDVQPKIPELRKQADKNRQSSTDLLESSAQAFYLIDRISEIYKESQDVYKELLAAGVAKECARDVLPLATPSRLYMHGTIRSWIHYIQLRTKPDTQKEHRQIADDALFYLDRYFPTVVDALNFFNNNRYY